MNDPAVRTAIAAAATRFTDLIRVLPDPGTSVAGSDWDCADVAAHVAIVVNSYRPYLTGDPTPILDYRDLPASNARTLQEYASRDPAEIADRILEATGAFLDLTATRDGETMPWHGTTVPVPAVQGIYLAELLLHGRDIATATGRPWAITEADAAGAVDGAVEVAPLFVDPGRTRDLTASYRLQLRGAGCYRFDFRRGELTVEREPARTSRVDCRISATPLAMLLVSYRRENQWRYIATGRLRATGRRPWLGLRFAGLFRRF